MVQEWFRSWFDTPYYSLLYQHRDSQEARRFIEHLVSFMGLPTGAQVLDLACGTGRHSLQLARLGFNVTGVDLSQKNIAEAIEAARLQTDLPGKARFLVGDMRQLDFTATFDAAFNLFTSLGYFDEPGENLQVVQSTARALKPGGQLVIDFLNPAYVLRHLVAQESHEIAGVQFEIRRRVERGVVEKAIRIKDGGKILHFTEHVQLLELKDFERIFKKARFKLEYVWGDYTGAPYLEAHSPRMVLLARLENPAQLMLETDLMVDTAIPPSRW
jgi:ubiquinone/menaquinone biosynthesis C-methylase UbiE